MTFIQTVVRAKDPYAVAERQVGMACIFFLAYLMFFIPGISANPIWLVVVGGVLVAGTTVAALRLSWRTIPTSWHLVIPLIDLFAAGLLRAGTGNTTSPFTALLVLPVLSLGIERGRRPVVISAVSTLVIVLIPLLLHADRESVGDWLRAFFTPAVLAAASLSVNELASRLRSRYARVAELRAEQESLLRQAQDLVLESTAASSLMRESAEQLASVIDAVTEQGIVATDSDGVIDVFNTGAERMLSIPSHEVLGRHLAAAVRGDLHAAAKPGPDMNRAPNMEALQILLDSADDEAQMREFSFLRADGKSLTLHISITTRHDAAGDRDGLLFVLTDMTAIAEASRMKDEFTGLISHELRTPLSSILGYLELIEDDEDHPLSEHQHRYLRTIERNAQRLLRLVGDLLFTAQVEAGKFGMDATPLDLRAIVTAAADTMRPQADAAGVALSVFTPDTPITVNGDPVRLGQACDNLVSNAVKFTKSGGRVAINATLDENTKGEPVARLNVSDTGVGIPPDELDSLFTRFFRASTATANAVAGVGLGLTITKAIATAHGGRIRVASTPGEGTTFSLELPVNLKLAG